MSKWRVLTAYLRPDLTSEPDVLRERDVKIASMADRFATAFSSFEYEKRDPDAARTHLINLLRSAADVAYTLFTQPSTFEFRWRQQMKRKEVAAARPSVAVVPELRKVADEHGLELAKGQILFEMVREQL